MLIPTSDIRMQRGMADSDVCTICNSAMDSWRYSLLDCNMARAVWALAEEELVEHMISNCSTDAGIWLFWLRDTLNQNDLASPCDLVVNLVG